MAEVASDSTLSQAPAGKSQRTLSATHTQQKRNNRNRKNINNQFDGAVSDGAVAMPNSSPQSKKAPKHRLQSENMGARPVQQHASSGSQHVQRSRPISVGAGLQPDTPAKDFEQAYAGPTFSNSPAASALPVPTKFFSKSVPNVARSPPARSKLSGSRPQTKHQPSPESDVASPAAAPEPPQSPLDLFFKADRREKEQSRNLSQSLSPNAARASPAAGCGYQQSSKSGKSIFLSELDGDDADMPSPRAIPPGGRPSPVERAYSSPHVPLRAAESEDEHVANAKSLKDLLFSTALNASQTPPQSRSGRNSGLQTPDGVFGPPSPFNGSGPSTPQPLEQQNHYSLHYGNRNLSPLFKAQRTDTPPRPSNLRQEFPSDANATNGFQTPPHPSSVDPNTFARTYLKDQIRDHGPAEMPQFPFNSGLKPVHAAGNMHGSKAMPIPVQPVNAQHGGQQSSASPRTGSQDIQTMEKNLRSMLKLNV